MLNSPRYRIPLIGTLAGLGLTVIAIPAFAGTATIRSADGGEAVFEYRDDMLRIGMGDGQSYAVVRDGTIYAVSVENGQTMVIDAGSVMRGFASTATAMAPSDLTAEVLSMKNTGRSEEIAGLRGDVYEVTFTDDQGREQQEEIVLSKDKAALEFRDALFQMLTVASDMAPANAREQAQEQSEDVYQRLSSLNAGVLRYGQELLITEISGAKVPSVRFELPAEPMNLEGLGSMLGGMSNQANDTDAADEDGAEPSGGLFSSMMGALGGKVDRQTDRAGQTVENEIDKETDEAVDKGIGKALGKLFGN